MTSLLQNLKVYAKVSNSPCVNTEITKLVLVRIIKYSVTTTGDGKHAVSKVKEWGKGAGPFSIGRVRILRLCYGRPAYDADVWK